ncbi:hypothetical protein [uncultured Litoreibacter sp.]
MPYARCCLLGRRRRKRRPFRPQS